MFRKYLVVVMVLVLAAFGFGYGPVNKPADKAGPSAGGGASIGVEGRARLSKQELFVVFVALSSSSSGDRTELGDATYLIRCMRGDSLGGLSQAAKVSVIYEMPTMPEMGKYDAAAVRQGDGSFLAPVFFSMPGLWEITVKIEDGSVQDEYVFETTL